MMERDKRVLITGASGMVGSAVCRLLEQQAETEVLAPGHSELDLADQTEVDHYFDIHRPETVLMIAAKVGGIAANMADPVGFLSENARIQLNLFEACHKYGVRKSLFLGSSCIYPRECPQPMKEESLLTGPLEPTNEGYALAKILGLKLAQYYYRQHGMLTICPIPCNIYGTNDDFDPQNSHVLSALVRRFADGRDSASSEVVLWGTGVARREFIHVDDVAEALLFMMQHVETPDPINLGTGTDISILDLAYLVAELVGYTGGIRWDSSKPGGMLRKCLDVSRLDAMGYRPTIGLRDGVARSIGEYRERKRTGTI
jgi:GDP-L-fucose synthase